MANLISEVGSDDARYRKLAAERLAHWRIRLDRVLLASQVCGVLCVLGFTGGAVSFAREGNWPAAASILLAAALACGGFVVARLLSMTGVMVVAYHEGLCNAADAAESWQTQARHWQLLYFALYRVVHGTEPPSDE